MTETIQPCALTRYLGFAQSARARLRAAAFTEAAIAANVPDTAIARVAQLRQQQPEHTLTPGAYVARLVTPERRAAGRTLLVEHGAELRAIAQAFGVPAQICLAIWGIESRYGDNKGDWPVLGALATLAACDERRAEFWARERDAALAILIRRGGGDRVLLGSWAGAMGHVQFMPTTYQRFAVDFDGDGFADIWDSRPDALASAANYLAAHGWDRSRVIVQSVQVDPAFDWASHAVAQGDSVPDAAMAVWRARGVTPTGALAAGTDPQESLKLIAPEGADGPAFLVGCNFASVLAYNAAQPYALAVCLLGSAIAGDSAPLSGWRPPDHGLTHEEKVQLQVRLAAFGWDTGGVDGILGAKSRDAVRALQQHLGVACDGYADRKLLEALAAHDVRHAEI